MAVYRMGGAGGEERNRTPDRLLTERLLYRLSYRAPVPDSRPAFTTWATARVDRLRYPPMVTLVTFADWYIVPYRHRYIVPLRLRFSSLGLWQIIIFSFELREQVCERIATMIDLHPLHHAPLYSVRNLCRSVYLTLHRLFK